MTRGHRGSRLLRCEALSSSTLYRFLLAHDRFGPSTTGLLACVHRGAWWVKVDVIGKLRSGSTAPSRATRSMDLDR